MSAGGASTEGPPGSGGFTLIEVLIVTVILAILAAIAIPAFLETRDRAADGKAKVIARTAQSAIETYYTDADGSYAGADVSTLQAIEPTLVQGDLEVTPLSGGYRLRADSSTGQWFEIWRQDGGFTEYRCRPKGSGGCPPSGQWTG